MREATELPILWRGAGVARGGPGCERGRVRPRPRRLRRGGAAARSTRPRPRPRDRLRRRGLRRTSSWSARSSGSTRRSSSSCPIATATSDEDLDMVLRLLHDVPAGKLAVAAVAVTTSGAGRRARAGRGGCRDRRRGRRRRRARRWRSPRRLSRPSPSLRPASADSRWGGPKTALAAVLGLAATLRLVGIRHGLPYPGLVDRGEQGRRRPRVADVARRGIRSAFVSSAARISRAAGCRRGALRAPEPPRGAAPRRRARRGCRRRDVVARDRRTGRSRAPWRARRSRSRRPHVAHAHARNARRRRDPRRCASHSRSRCAAGCSRRRSPRVSR